MNSIFVTSFKIWLKAYINLSEEYIKGIIRSLENRAITIDIALALFKKQTNSLKYSLFSIHIFKPLILIFKITLFLDFIFIVFSEFYKNFILCHSESYESFCMKC